MRAAGASRWILQSAVRIAGEFKMISRPLFLCSVITVACAVSTSVLAQDVRDRELRPAFDFTTIQMPVEISLKLNGRDDQAVDIGVSLNSQ